MIKFTFSDIIELAAVISATAVIYKLVNGFFKRKQTREKESKEIKELKEEQTLLTFGVLACLKGLKEKGCNGPVTEAIGKIEKHLNIAAHK